MLKWTIRILLLLTLVGGIAAYALPGPQQALLPRSNGLVEIGDNLFTDAPDRAEEFRAMLHDAEDEVSGFFGPLRASPRIILCTTSRCALRLLNSERARGMTYGYNLIVLTPRGVNRMILSHERAHTELHARMNLRDVMAQRFPAWFDEGLASWISRDDRLTHPGADGLARVLKAVSFRDWGRLVPEMGWKTAYGAAKRHIEDFVAVAGEDGLRSLIDRIEAGEDFNVVFADLGREPR